MAKKTNKKTYELHELADIDIDAWVEGISAMVDIAEVRDEAYLLAGEEFNEDAPLCPAELETEYNMLARKYKFRFTRKGAVASYNLNVGKNK